jgi:hypothetical protein
MADDKGENSMTVKVRRDNRTVTESAAATRIRAEMAAEQKHRRALELARSRAMKLPPGSTLTAATISAPARERIR